MVFNHKKNWTFRRLIKTNDHPGMKIFRKVVRSVENRFKPDEPTSEIPVRMSDLNVSMDSLNSHSKMRPIKSDKTKKSVRSDMKLEKYSAKQIDQYLELCKVKIYVTPSVEMTTVDVHDVQKQKNSNANSNGRNNFKESEDCYKSATSLQELSESSTYLSVEDVNDICENLEDIVEDDSVENNIVATIEQPFFREDSAENEIVRCEVKQAEDDLVSLTSKQEEYNQTLTCVEPVEKNGTNCNLGNVIEDDRKQNDLEQKKDVDIEDANLCDIEKDSVDSSKPAGLLNELNILQPNTKDIKTNEIDDGHSQDTFEKTNDMVAAVVVSAQSPEYVKVNFFDISQQVKNIEEDPVNSSLKFIVATPIDDVLEINSNDVGKNYTNEDDIENGCKQNIMEEHSPKAALAIKQRPEDFKISFCGTGQQQDCAEETSENSSKLVDVRNESVVLQPHLSIIDTVKDNNKVKIKGHKSLVKDMIAMFNQNLRKKTSEQRNCHDVLDEITSYPWNLVRQRINQFSKEKDDADAITNGCNKKSQDGISQSLVQQRIQQLLVDTNMKKILRFHSSNLTATEVKDPQTIGKNNMEKPVQTEGSRGIQAESDFYHSNNSRTFIRNLQLLLNLHQGIDESDNDSHSSEFTSDSLETPTHDEIENSANLLRRSFGVENLSHLKNDEDCNLGCQNSEGCEFELISSSDDGEEKIYSQFVGYARDQSSPSNTTPNLYETIQESETESTEDYSTPVGIGLSMPQNSAARRNEEITKKFVMNLYESGQMRSPDSCVALKKPADYKIIHSENELHIKNMEVIGDKERVNYGKLNKHSSESDNRISRRVDSVNVGGDNCINVEVPTEFCEEHILLEGSDAEADRNLTQANGEVEMEENIYALAESENGEKRLKSDDETYFTLKHETDVQGIIIQQASKALEICKKSKNFLAGKELIEAERILLVATCKYELLRKEIQKAKYDSFKPRNDHALGNISIDNLFLPLQLNEADFTHCNYYFILILSHKDTVFFTKVVEGNSMNYANFEDAFTFQDLPSDFIITIDIYGLKVKKLEDKNRLSKKLKTKKKLENLCPKKRLFYKDVQTITLMETSVSQSSFSLCGSVVVTLADINNNSNNWSIKNACHNIISNTMNLNASISDVRIECNKKGFLTVGREINGHLAWNRRWCVLDGAILKFFNYPSDEDLIDPTVILNFKHCFSGEIEVCDRERCAKSRTMLLKTRSMVNGAPESVGHFLSADSRKDLLEWQSRINSILGALVKWNQLSSNCSV